MSLQEQIDQLNRLTEEEQQIVRAVYMWEYDTFERIPNDEDRRDWSETAEPLDRSIHSVPAYLISPVVGRSPEALEPCLAELVDQRILSVLLGADGRILSHHDMPRGIWEIRGRTFNVDIDWNRGVVFTYWDDDPRRLMLELWPYSAYSVSEAWRSAVNRWYYEITEEGSETAERAKAEATASSQGRAEGESTGQVQADRASEIGCEAARREGVETPDDPGPGHQAPDKSRMDAEDVADIPALDVDSVDWVSNKEAAKLTGYKVESLKTFRKGGRKAPDGLSGIDTKGYMWRKRRRRQEHPYYHRPSLRI